MPSSTLFNPTQFPVFIEELGKQLAPFEAIAVDDAEIVARHIATGVLRDNTDELEAEIKSRAEELAASLGKDAEEAEEDIRKELAERIATFHDEHDAPKGQVVKDGETATAEPVVDHSGEVRVDGTPTTPAERIQAAKADAGELGHISADGDTFKIEGGTIDPNSVPRLNDEVAPVAPVSDPAMSIEAAPAV